MDRRWIKLACGCDIIVGKGELLHPGDEYMCVQHALQEIKRVNRLKG